MTGATESVPRVLVGSMVTLRGTTSADLPALTRIRAHPEVVRWWRGEPDLAATVAEEFADPDTHCLVIGYADQLVGEIRWSAEEDPDYRRAGIDIYLDPAVRGRGLGVDAIRTLVRYLIDEHGHHRLTIDPAADNAAAIRCYTKVGFRAVGIMRQYERGSDGSWHDGLLMDLLAVEFGAAG